MSNHFDPDEVSELSSINVERLLADTLLDDHGGFSFWRFFEKWFREKGSSYYFVFKKNLRVTNIQFAELTALIRSHNLVRGTEESLHDLQFVALQDFITGLQELVESFSPLSTHNVNELIASLYAPVLRRQIVIHQFFGSCAVFIPPHLDIDLASVCGYSGYIHDCGEIVYLQQVDYAGKHVFFDAIDRYLLSRRDRESVFFTMFAHEDFTPNDRMMESYLRDGLDDLKFYVEKFYMGTHLLVSVLHEMREKFAGRLVIPEPGDFRETHPKLREQKNVDASRSLWFLVDQSVGPNPREKGEERFFICYEQQFVNENPFHIFDENKPAWIAPVTIPHTLLGAMLNLTEVSRGRDAKRKVIVRDPFSGTGTTWLECLKYQNVLAQCSDLEPITPALVADNLKFFKTSTSDLKRLIGQLEALTASAVEKLQQPERITGGKNEPALEAYNKAIALFDTVHLDDRTYAVTFPKALIRSLRRLTLLERILFYLALRTARRNMAAIERRSATWSTIFCKEARSLVAQIKTLCTQRERGRKEYNGHANFALAQGNYSLSLSLAKAVLKSTPDPTNRAITVKDALDIEPDSCDIIVTDPPYGFNTDDDPHQLASLYSQMISVFIRALKNEGQLVLCLPDRSHIGRRSYFFTHKQMVTHQVLAAAEAAHREVIALTFAVPRRDIFRPPYYWESERALRRAILHFRIRDIV